MRFLLSVAAPVRAFEPASEHYLCVRFLGSEIRLKLPQTDGAGGRFGKGFRSFVAQVEESRRAQRQPRRREPREKTMSTQNTVKLHRVLRAPPQRIYRAFLDPDAMAKWLPPHG